jgi:CheY-like chemotaxis protein
VVARQLVLVDDDTTTREIMVSSLQECGYEVFDFEGSEDALIRVDTLYREGVRPTLLIDLIMPRMDGSGILGGLELLDLVHTNFPELPVLVVADYNNSDAERKVREMGYAFAMKPRKTELVDPGTVEVFSVLLRQELRRVEAGEAPTEWNDKVNIADELRLEMGEELGPGRGTLEQSTGISLLRGMLEELNNPSLGGGIILLVLRFASEFMNRAVVFIVKKDEIVGLGQFGIQDREGLADSRVRSMRIPRDEDSLFARVIESQQPLKVKPDEVHWNRYLIERLGGEYPAEVFAGPIVSEGKVVAILYGDNLPEHKPVGDTDSLEIFLSQAGMAMEKVLLQRRLQDKSPEGL